MATNDPDIITIRNVTTNKIQKGANTGNEYLMVTDATDRRLFVFDNALFGALTQGATLEIETKWSKDGKSESITSAKPANGHAPAVAIAPTMDREQSIRRQVALKCATEIVCATASLPDSKTDGETVLSYARLFADWLNSDDESPF